VTGIFALAIITVILIHSIRSDRDRSPYLQALPSLQRIVVPSGSYLNLKIVGSVLQNAEMGETFEALIAERVLVGGQLAIPENTRAALQIENVQKRNGDAVDVTVKATELIFTDQKVSIDTLPLVATMRPMSAFDLMMRSAGGLISAAVGAARRAADQGNSIGVDAFEGLATGSAPEHDPFALLRLQTAEPIDLTGIRW
jgi:hypothetical protein